MADIVTRASELAFSVPTFTANASALATNGDTGDFITIYTAARPRRPIKRDAVS
jgi:hypothetical protein